jgi:hypothetical protein
MTGSALKLKSAIAAEISALCTASLRLAARRRDPHLHERGVASRRAERAAAHDKCSHVHPIRVRTRRLARSILPGEVPLASLPTMIEVDAHAGASSEAG